MSTFPKLVCAALLLLCACYAMADSPAGKLRGVVTDDSGGRIDRARILVHWDRSGADVGLTSNVGIANDLWLDTNRMGEFATELPPGFYDIFVSTTSFSPYCRKIRVKPGESATFDLELVVNPLVTKELGFEIPDAK